MKTEEIRIVRADINLDLADLVMVIALAERTRDAVRRLAAVTKNAPLQGLAQHYDAVIGRVDKAAVDALWAAGVNSTKKVQQFGNGICKIVDSFTAQ